MNKKYVVILGDGMADYADENGKTPLMYAKKDNIDRIASMSQAGLCQTIPEKMSPGSDTANLSVMGYDPKIYYTGRSPLEAISIGIKLGEGDITYRLNLVTLSDDEPFENKKMLDYSAGEISTDNAKKLIALLQPIVPQGLELYAGVSYRHCLVRRRGEKGALLTPPHDITGKTIASYLPKNGFSKTLLDFMKESSALLSKVKDPSTKANCVWLWGEGSKPELESFEKKFGVKGAVISAVDLIKGIGIGAGMQSIDVKGATGTLRTNFDGKAAAAIEALKTNDYVYVHLEAPDECGHQGDKPGKIRAIELIDEKIVKPVFEHLQKCGGEFKMLIIPDHATPLSLRTHTSDPVPYILYDSQNIKKGPSSYDESSAKNSGNHINAADLSKLLFD